MRKETIAIHAGYRPEGPTRSVAVPIYQTVAYAFDSAEHGAALFNLEAEGFRSVWDEQSDCSSARTACSKKLEGESLRSA